MPTYAGKKKTEIKNTKTDGATRTKKDHFDCQGGGISFEKRKVKSHVSRPVSLNSWFFIIYRVKQQRQKGNVDLLNGIAKKISGL